MFENLSADASSNIKNFSLYYSSLTMIVIYSCMAAVGIIGNIVTCIVIANNKSMHTATNCYLFNLAVSDLIILMLGVPVFNTMSYNNIFTCHLRWVFYWFLLSFQIIEANYRVVFNPQ